MSSQRNGLERSLGFMMGSTYRKLSIMFHNWLKEFDITPEQWTVLYQINQSEGLIQKEIAERTDKDKPTTTRILDLLEDKGLISKRPGTNDRRSFLVFTTAKGRELIEETIPIEQRVTEEIKQGMSEDEYETLLGLHRTLYNHMRKIIKQE